jgi:hypothetical protein
VYKRSTAAIIGRFKQVSDVIRINVNIMARKSSLFAVCTQIENGGCTKPNTVWYAGTNVIGSRTSFVVASVRSSIH